MGICFLVLKYTHLRTVQDYEKSALTFTLKHIQITKIQTHQPIYFISITLYLSKHIKGNGTETNMWKG